MQNRLLVRQGNPFLHSHRYRRVASASEPSMSIKWMLLDTIYHLIIVMLLTHWYSLNYRALGSLIGVVLVGGMGSFFMGCFIYFRPQRSALFITSCMMFLSFFLGGMISLFNELNYPILGKIIFLGIWMHILFSILCLFGLSRMGRNWKYSVGLSIGAVFLVYLFNFILKNINYHPLPFGYLDSVGTSIITFVSCFLISSSLFSNFYFLEKISKKNLPKYMNTYGAFSLIFLIVWFLFEPLYILSRNKVK